MVMGSQKKPAKNEKSIWQDWYAHSGEQGEIYQSNLKDTKLINDSGWLSDNSRAASQSNNHHTTRHWTGTLNT